MKQGFCRGGALRGSVLALVGMLAAPASFSAEPATILAHPQSTSLIGTEVSFANTMASRRNEAVEVFVRFDAPSVAEYVVNEIRAGRGRPNHIRQLAQFRRIMAQQAEMRVSLSQLGGAEMSALQVGANGLRMMAKPRDIAAILQVAGVRSVGRVAQFRPTLVESVPWIGAPAAWAASGTGEGMTIAVIDTGVDYTHANFGGSGDPADFTANDPNVIEPGSFPTAKVTFGFDFAGTAYDASSPDPAINTPVPDPDPMDENFHGSHVAGDAAGMGVPGSVGPGVAKGAEIWALKVFGAAGSTNLVSDAVELALDPNGDGSVDDHVDVINLSLGSDLGDPNEPSAIATQAASDLGVIVVAAAGNAGNVPYILGSPAIARDVISVAASIPGGRLQATFEVTAPPAETGFFPTAEGGGPVRIADVVPFSGVLVPAAPLEGCDPLTNPADIAGHVALIMRGTCFFDTKYANAQDAGATAIVVYNDGANPSRVDPFVMGGISDTVTIPGVMISSTEGTALSDAIALGDVVEIALGVIPNDAQADTIASFSSRGPGAGGTSFKPDVTAPGVSIASTDFGSGTGAVISSGTSFSSPHVAGEAALIAAVNPTLAPAEIKAIIQNGTVTAHVDGLGGSDAYPLARQGTGVVRVDKAAALTSFAQPGGISFGYVNPGRLKRVTRTVTVHNMSDTTRVFTVTHVAGQTFPGVEVSVRGRGKLRIAPHSSRFFRAQLTMDPTVGPFDPGFFSQTEVDGWFEITDGTDALRVGYVAAVDPASKMLARPGPGRISIANSIARGVGSLGFAEGFTKVGRGGLLLDALPNAIKAVGWRNNDFGFPVVEFGIATERPWDTASAFETDILIDADGDGAFESTLVAADEGLLTTGVANGNIATAIFSAAGGFLLFNANGDQNDAAIVLPFVREDFGLGFLAPGDTDFDYVVETFDLRSGSVDVQAGHIDLAKEIVATDGGVPLRSFGLAPGGSATLPTAGGRGRMLWLFQNNVARRQSSSVRVR